MTTKGYLCKTQDAKVLYGNLRRLDKVGAEPEPEKESLLSAWLCRLGILRRREGEPQPPTLQLSEEMLARVMRCLKLYYQLKVRVETICAEQEISPQDTLSVS